MRRLGLACLVLVIAATIAPASQAATTALAGGDPETAPAPAFASGRVVWLSTRGDRSTLHSRSLTGGAGDRRLALPRTYVDRSLSGTTGELALSTPSGGIEPDRIQSFTPLLAPAGVDVRALADESSEIRPAFWAVTGGALIREIDPSDRRRLVLRRPGSPAETIRLPRGADASRAFATGSAVAVPVIKKGRGFSQIAIVSLSGSATRTVDAGGLRGLERPDLALGQDGSVAVVGDSRGTSRLAWAPAGGSHLIQVASGGNYVAPRPEGGRIALFAGGHPGEITDVGRVVVLAPSITGQGRSRIDFRGPPALESNGLAFDGVHVAWGADGCALLADADRASSTRSVPRGPCFRTVVKATTYIRPFDRRRRHVRIGVRCLTGPGDRCRFDVVVRSPDGHHATLGRRRASVRQGFRSKIAIGLPRRAVLRALRHGDPLLLTIRLKDPGGGRRVLPRMF